MNYNQVCLSIFQWATSKQFDFALFSFSIPSTCYRSTVKRYSSTKLCFHHHRDKRERFKTNRQTIEIKEDEQKQDRSWQK